MGGCLKLTILIGLLAALAFILAGCETVNNMPEPKPTITYETCDTPNCGDNVTIEVE